MFEKILVANRGEIAIRAFRAGYELGAKTVAVYPHEDRNSIHRQKAAEAYQIGEEGHPVRAYLDIDEIIRVAKEAGADAIYPGYGFLSENPDLARAAEAEGIKFIGPKADVLELAGNKVAALKAAREAGIPVLESSEPSDDVDYLIAEADRIGFPIFVKAVAGGGGRGMRRVDKREDLPELMGAAMREAGTAFGDPTVFLEQAVLRPRHIEVQILADEQGNIVHLHERDCSLQRRHQKLVEEAPAPFLTDEQRARIHESAKAICKEAGYVGAGTVEYLVAQDGLISFLEVNTRLQVEHPITEETSGVDLVAEQFRIADGLPLSITEDPQPTGHAIEFRINAEDPARGFLPAPGTVERFEAPTGAGVRVDSGVRSGSVIPPYYDSMIAKLIVRGADRDQAIRRARLALEEISIAGVPTVLPFHRAVIEHEAFNGDSLGVYTTWIEDEFLNEVEASDEMDLDQRDTSRETITIELDGKAVQLGLPAALTNALRNTSGGGSTAASQDEDGGAVDAAAVRSTMDGNLVRFAVEDGSEVTEGQSVAIVEAMKMESTITAHRGGIFQAADLGAGAALRRGDTLGTIG